MKFILIVIMFSSLALAKDNKPHKAEASKPLGDKARQIIEATKPEEDCDEKAKKPIEIKEEEPVLGLGNAGCSIEDM